MLSRISWTLARVSRGFIEGLVSVESSHRDYRGLSVLSELAARALRAPFKDLQCNISSDTLDVLGGLVEMFSQFY